MELAWGGRGQWYLNFGIDCDTEAYKISSTWQKICDIIVSAMLQIYSQQARTCKYEK